MPGYDGREQCAAILVSVFCAHVEAVDSHSFVFFCVREGSYEMIYLPSLVFGLEIVKLFNPDDKKANGYH